MLKDQLQLDFSHLLSKSPLLKEQTISQGVVGLAEPKMAEHGDFASNAAMVLAKSLGTNPRELASTIADIWKTHPDVNTIEVAGPGFINIRLNPSAITNQIYEILTRSHQFGNQKKTTARKLHVEFVSVNPNGPITIGSGRGAAFGDTLCRILRAAGDEVFAEYYINDALNSEQMRLFALSVQAHMKREAGIKAELPENGYRGDYVLAVSHELAKKISHDADLQTIQEEVQKEMIRQQRESLEAFRVHFDNWFSEQSLHAGGKVAEAIEKLKKNGHADSEPYSWETTRQGKDNVTTQTSQEPGPLWFRSQKLGDEKDRVLVRSDGRPAYIAGDLAYMQDKLGDRHFDQSLLILGPDHHGYIGRMDAVTRALGFEADRFRIIIYQLVRFLKEGQLAPMRKRDGNIYELKDLYKEIGVDAARFFYIMRSHDTPLDFDIDLALKLGDDNPVFYVQYAHARICSVLAKAEEEGIGKPLWNPSFADLLHDPKELNLVKRICDLPEVVSRCAEDFQVQRVATYAAELARAFHLFYDSCRVVQKDQPELSSARVCLVEAARIGLANALNLVGVSAPQRMHREQLVP